LEKKSRCGGGSNLEEVRLRANYLKMLAHPTRLLILESLSKGEKCVNELHELLDVTQPNVSQHLAALKKKGLVVSHKNGTKRCYHLAKPDMTKGLLALISRWSYPALDSKGVERCRARKTKLASKRT
jgi:ArsR family transcriptional regulator